MLQKKELISPVYLEEKSNERLGELLILRKKVIQKIEEISPKCFGKSLKVLKNHNSYQYYIRRSGKDGNGIYISKENKDLAILLANREYLIKVLKEIESEIKCLGKFTKKWKDKSLCSVYEKFSTGKRLLITPLIFTNEQYAENWKKQDYPKKPFTESAVEFYTSTGIRVRSKSEIILAETLTRLEIPFRYEFPVKMKTKNDVQIVFHPDFYCLNVRTREEVIWEHFGMMDNPEYVENVVEKIDIYHENDYFEGENLIFTMENKQCPLTTKKIEQLVNKYLK